MRILVGTRKGLFPIERRRDGWRIGDPRFLGVPVLNAMEDPRDRSVWACVGHGHWGPKLHASHDGMRTFPEKTCPRLPEGSDARTARQPPGPASVKALYAIAPHGEAGSYLAGTDPGALFRSTDAGATWTLNEPLWRRRAEDGWMEGGGGMMLHSIAVDASNPELFRIGVSCGGVYETADGGRTFAPRNRGVPADFLPEREPVAGQDTHMLRGHPRNPRLLWQQNHCGNFRSTDGGLSWVDVTVGLPTRIGFALALDDEREGTAWTVPMESDMARVAPKGSLVVCRTDDGGSSWRELREGLPQEHCYDIVFRHALDAAGGVVAFGTTCGRLFASENGGDRWALIAPWLPPVNSVSIVPGA